jgi:hypothetical protein
MFLHDKKLNKAVKDILSEPRFSCAVAYWGDGPNKWIGQGLKANASERRIVCDALSGSTNPYVLQKLFDRTDIQLKHCDHLHAKVYIGEAACVVGSCNASKNGIGGGEESDAGLIEAGVKIERDDEISEWFETIWKKARNLTKNDLALAMQKWKHRRRYRFGKSFFDWQPDHDDVPLLYWYDERNYKYNNASIAASSGKAEMTDAEVEQLTANSVFSESRVDTEVLRTKKWLLVFRKKLNEDKPCIVPKPYWFLPQHCLLDSARYTIDNETGDFDPQRLDIFLDAEKPEARPFDLEADFVWEAIRETMEKQEFHAVVGFDYRYKNYDTDAGYLDPKRRAKHYEFWKACQSLYRVKKGKHK